MGEHIGYIRVSSVGQNTERQLDGIERNKTFEDKLSGKDTDRPQLQACIEYLREGDTLHVHSMDRLSRNLTDLTDLITSLTKGKNITIHFHKEKIVFPGGQDITPMNELLFQVMGAVAQFERANIKERQLEGIAIAKKKGVYKGRKATIETKPILEARRAGMKKSEIVKKFPVSRSYLYKILEREGLK